VNEFTTWAATNGRDYKDSREFNKRLELWSTTDTIIEQTNHRSETSGVPDAVILGHNFTSDMTMEEKENMLGLLEPPSQRLQRKREGMKHPNRKNSEPKQESEESEKKDGRRLCDYGDIDWVRENRISKVKDQGYCGSCYAFGAITVVESMIAIE